MSAHYEQTLLKPQGRVLSTLEEDGSRRWLYPRLSRGRFWSRRRWVAYGLIGLFTALPFVRVNGKPAVLLDLAHRQFTLLGYTFLPTDTALLALFMLAALLTIFFVTALLGRVWCGWACPQTVYMEYVFRPVERLFLGRKGVGGKPREDVAAWRVVAMYAAFLLVSLYLANTFLAYFVGVEQLRVWVTRSPVEHPASFLIVAVTTALMMFDFAYFREQTCIIACPYGRIQSVLTDRQSLVISYDVNRGEPRGPVRRVGLKVAEPALAAAAVEGKKGDCVDCDMCVSVCPTGIDIRDGLQIECIGCAQCIDACDTVMAKVGRPLGLIRYSSQAAMAGERARVLRPRVVVYSVVVLAIVSLLAVLVATKAPADVTLLRSIGRPFVMTADGRVENTMRVKVTNRTEGALRLRFSVPGREDVAVRATREVVEVGPGEMWTEPVQVVAPASAFKLGAADVTLRVGDEAAGVKVDTECRLLGPLGG